MMSEKPADKNEDEIFGEFSKTKTIIAQVLAALSRGIAELIRQPFKGLKNRLISLIAALLIVVNPVWGKGVLNFVIKHISIYKIDDGWWDKNYTTWWFYLLVGAVLLALVIMVWEQLNRQPLPPTQFRNRAIKGLLAFEQSDAEIFKKLEREADVQQILSALTNQKFRFGVLTGVSGCGKSSLLNAGLLPALAENKQCAVIATITGEPPLESIQRAIASQLGIRFEEKAKNLQGVLEVALQASEKAGFILILDQFEQFFTQNKTEESREAFINELWNAYLNADGVKILLSIRLDFMGRLHEIQQQIQYSLTAGQNYFDLRKFKPEQALRIFSVMSEQGNLQAFDEAFMFKMIKEELASNDDGLVAAADVQWVATALQQVEGRAFDENTFRKNGGVQGMMQQYLQKLLETPNAFNLNQEALKALLAFVDLDNNTRKGRLSAAELRQILSDQISIENLAINLDWLTQNRLLNRIDDKQIGKPKWELAHERLISPLRILANKALTGLDKSRLLLERRVNEWLANQRSSRFLLSWKEYFSLKKNAPYLVVEPNKAAKNDLLKSSGKKIKRWNYAAIAAIISVIAFGLVYRSVWFKVEKLAKWTISNNINNYYFGKTSGNLDYKTVLLDSLVAVSFEHAFLIVENWGKQEREDAFSSLWRKIDKRVSQEHKDACFRHLDGKPEIKKFLDAVDSLPIDPLSKSFLKVSGIINPLNTILSNRNKIRITNAVVKNPIDSKILEIGASVLKSLKNTANKYEDENSRVRTFISLAKFANILNLKDEVYDCLQQAEKSVLNIKEPHRSHIHYFSELAAIAINSNLKEQAISYIHSAEKISQENIGKHKHIVGGNTLCTLAQSAGELKMPQKSFYFLKKAETEFQNQNLNNNIYNNLLTIINSTKVLPPSTETAQFIQKLKRNVDSLQNTRSRVENYIALAEVSDAINLEDNVPKFKHLAAVNLQELSPVTSIINIIDFAQKINKLKGPEYTVIDFEIILKGLQAPKRVNFGSNIIIALANAVQDLVPSGQEILFLKRLGKVAQNIKGERQEHHAQLVLAQAMAKLGYHEDAAFVLHRLGQNVRNIKNEAYRIEISTSLSDSLAKFTEIKHPIALLQPLLQGTYTIDNDQLRPPVLNALARAIKNQSEPEQEFLFLENIHKSAEKIKDERLRAEVLASLAYEVSGQPELVLSFLKKIEGNAHKFKNPSLGSNVLIALAHTMAEINQPKRSMQLLSNSKYKIHAGHNPEALAKLAEVATGMHDPRAALSFLWQLESYSHKLSHTNIRIRLLSEIANSAVKLKIPEKRILGLLNKIAQDAVELHNESQRAELFLALSKAANEMGNKNKAFSYLQQLENSLGENRNEKNRAELLVKLAQATADIDLDNPAQIKSFLERLHATHAIQFEPRSHALTVYLQGLSEVYADLGAFRKSYDLADQIENKYPEKILALIHLQKRYKERRDAQIRR